MTTADRIAFIVVALVALLCSTFLYHSGKDAGAAAVLGGATTLLVAFWGQAQANKASATALLVPPPVK
jgi:hypothetical protein